jgi:rubrerythrin
MLQAASGNALIIDHLRTAYSEEANSHAQYAAFAGKADGEGWHGIASLFRAAARAEQVHAANHGRILNQLHGYEPVQLVRFEVLTTLDNMRSALAQERRQVEMTYPCLEEHARQSGDPAVTRSFRWALETEKSHVRLFEDTLDLLEREEEDSWITMPRTFYVCPVCGYSSEDANESPMCPVCNCAWKTFDRIR